MQKSKPKPLTSKKSDAPKTDTLRSFSILQLIKEWCRPTLLALLVVCWAALVRINNIEYIPFANDGDEMAYIYAGQTLLELGTPISWSSLHLPDSFLYTRVTQHDTVTGTQYYALHRPWVDHPPLLSILGGVISKLTHTPVLQPPPAFAYRLPVVIMSVLTLWSLYRLSSKYFGEWPSLAVLVLYAASPLLITGQRMFTGDGFVTFFMIGGLSIVLLNPLTALSFVSLLMIAVLSVLAKPTGILAIAVISSALWFTHRYKQAMVFAVVAVLLSGLALGTYGWSVAQDTFITTLKAQSFRLLGWANPAHTFASPALLNYEMLDLGYFVILALALWGLVSSDQLEKSTDQDAMTAFKFSWILALFLLWASAAEQDVLGWYRLPLVALSFPLAARALKNTDLWSMSMLGMIIVLNNLGIVRYPTHPLPDSWVLRPILLIALILCFVGFWLRNMLPRWVAVGVAVCVSGAYLLYAGYFSQYYFQAYCQDQNCPTPLITLKSVFRSGWTLPSQ